MSTYVFQINRILEKTPKEIADYTLFNLILVLEELWNHSRYQDNGILKEYVKIFFPNKQNLGKASKKNSNTHYLKNSQNILLK
jgi:hypothetical protein